MDIKTKKLTQGALITAVFGVLVYLNRQSAGMFEGIMAYFYSLPITIYIAWYGMKAGGAVIAAMVLLSFILGTPTYALFSCLCLVTGLIFGECLHKKIPSEKTLLAVVFTGLIVSIVDLICMAFISGVSLESEAVEFKNIITESFEKAGDGMDEESMKVLMSAFSLDMVKKMLVICQAFSGALRGFITYEIGLLIMRKLRIKVQKPKAISSLRPPKWTGFVAIIGYFACVFLMQSAQTEDLKNNLLMVSLVFYFFLIVFGVFGGIILFKRLMPNSKAFPVILSILAVFMLPYFVMGVGFLNITGIGGLFNTEIEETDYEFREVDKS